MDSLFPPNEVDRLQTLSSYGILDTPAEQNFDDLTQLAATICRTPVALITFIAADRQWFKSSLGTDLTETCRADSFCTHTIVQEGPLIVPDATQDERFASLPVVVNAPFVRFYAGAPLLTSDGYALGSLCVLDVVPRELEAAQIEALQVLARQVVTLLELRRSVIERESIARQLHRSESRLRLITDTVPALISYLDCDGVYRFNNRAYEEWFGISLQELQGKTLREMVGENTYAQIEPHLLTALKGERVIFDSSVAPRGDIVRYTHSTYVPDVDEAGRVRGVVALVHDVTERRVAALQLQESEQRYRSLFDYNVDAVYSFDLAGAFTSANAACQSLTGYDLAELRDISFAPLIVPEHLQRTLTHFERAAQGEAQNYETAIITKTGMRTEVSVTNSPIVIDGQIIGVFGVARDITRRIRTEENLRHANQQIANIFESITDAVVAFDREMRYTFVNERATKTLQKSASELLGQILWELFPSQKDSDSFECLHRALATGEKTQWETFIAETNDWVEATAYPSRDGVSVYFQTITERKRLAQAAINQEKWLRQVLDLMPIAILFVDPQTGAITFANRAAAQMTGGDFPKAQGIEQYESLYLVTDDEGRPLTVDEYPASRLARGERLEGQQLIWHINGVPHALLIEGETLPAAYEQNAVGVMVLQDISALKTIENQLREASRLKDEFLATVSHELRTPLTAIIGWTHLLRTKQLDEATVDKALETIERNGRAQSQLIEDLLDVSRIITGNLRLELERVELAFIIENAVESVRPAANAKGVQVQTSLDNNSGSVAGDPDRLQQIVWNLLSNAVKFTPRGGSVFIALTRQQSQIKILVSDTGQGIASDFLPHVFDRFRQADGASTRAHGGLGLGLAITRHLVELHGGTIEVHSDGVDLGTTFTMCLPLKMEEVQPEFLERREVEAAANALPDNSFDLSDLRILVVEDEDDTRDLLILMLQERGAKVQGANSASSALQVLADASEGFDVLLSDIGMPGTDGYSLLKQIRALRGGRIPAVAITAYARVEDRVRALNAGFQAHIPKPVQAVEIIAVIASLTGRTGN